ncbi:MAG: acetyl-CoA carboxylase carboxyltransferase subunit alpha [Candidatus Aminicenantes bacterium RBG_13_63_10]|nr:MAG: acetyl-CoA carboxylase carboxyltransferase subunit alpha [Candidatus Aminicenantes bacterium RBG_13_63_10]
METMKKHVDFYSLEKHIVALKQQIDELNIGEDPDKKGKIAKLRHEIEVEWAEISPGLTPWQIVQIARHPKRPYTLDYIDSLTTDFMELHGDRRFGDDPAMVSGFAFYKERSVCIVGHQKGRTTKERIARNFGQPNPEGYRKALRIMRLAEKFGCPIISLIDTQGAAPGIGAEERGQAEAIAYNLREISMIRVPIVCVVIGEGGSGGALAVGVGDQVLMLENGFYSVISPEGCAAILWKDQSAVAQAAENLKIRAGDLLEMGLIDKIIPEPPGAAHIDPEQTYKNVDKFLNQALKKYEGRPVDELLAERYQKIRKMGVYTEK